jgi:hypothetical protein
MRRLSPRRVPEQRSRPLEITAGRAWRYSSLWRLPPSAAMRSDGSRPVPWSTGRRRSLTGSGDLGSALCLSHMRNLLPNRL